MADVSIAEKTDLEVLYQKVGMWPSEESVSFPLNATASRRLNAQLGQIARLSTAVTSKVFRALEENDDGVPWSESRRKHDAVELLFVSLAHVRVLGITDTEVLSIFSKIAEAGGPK